MGHPVDYCAMQYSINQPL